MGGAVTGLSFSFFSVPLKICTLGRDRWPTPECGTARVVTRSEPSLYGSRSFHRDHLFSAIRSCVSALYPPVVYDRTLTELVSGNIIFNWLLVWIADVYSCFYLENNLVYKSLLAQL